MQLPVSGTGFLPTVRLHLHPLKSEVLIDRPPGMQMLCLNTVTLSRPAQRHLPFIF